MGASACPECDRPFSGKCAKFHGTGVNQQLNSRQAACPACGGGGGCVACAGTGWRRTVALHDIIPDWLSRLFEK